MISQAKGRKSTTSPGTTTSLNSGDWIKNRTALEYHEKRWSLYKHDTKAFATVEEKQFEFKEKRIEQLILSNIFTKK